MAEKSGFFNSVAGDRVYDASDVARFLKKFFTNGIFNNSLKVTANNNMTVSLEVGQANIEGYSYELDETKTFDIAESDDTLSRIDSVILRLDLTNRQITSMILQGSYATNPSQPSIMRSGNTYDLRLANVNIPSGATRITANSITDTRLGSDCGNVTQAVNSLDTTDLFNQYETWFNDWFEQMKSQLSTDAAGNLQNEINDIRKVFGIYTDTYDNQKTYMVGNLVVYNHTIYECITAVTTAEEFDSSKWQVVPLLKFD